MKKTLLFVLVVACFASCKKDDNPKIPSVNGTWELRSISGGFSPGVSIAPGKGDKYQFNTNSTYTKSSDGKETAKGKFSINFTGEERGFKYGTITFTNPDYRDAFSYKPDTIYIGTSIADGPTYQYIKIK
ncbi:hypothetical protein EWM62_08150 [Mucilaginibacter terrigena]|uniref:Lipocalin-like domain-containing protein n=1 Tax=Mucilaginibacter terrigena TaxID=2492395 RepID=A0A4Q5LLJ9_9SPHI|nr:hypothetical protein [Mucilaginibacter terrigena]RYU90614.1 hypothetical protein EWM62_08150 [Mucilaginibacter terrigena]